MQHTQAAIDMFKWADWRRRFGPHVGPLLGKRTPRRGTLYNANIRRSGWWKYHESSPAPYKSCRHRWYSSAASRSVHSRPKRVHKSIENEAVFLVRAHSALRMNWNTLRRKQTSPMEWGTGISKRSSCCTKLANSLARSTCLRMCCRIPSAPYERITNHSFSERNRRPSGICQCWTIFQLMNWILNYIKTHLPDNPGPILDCHVSSKADPHWKHPPGHWGSSAFSSTSFFKLRRTISKQMNELKNLI